MKRKKEKEDPAKTDNRLVNIDGAADRSVVITGDGNQVEITYQSTPSAPAQPDIAPPVPGLFLGREADLRAIKERLQPAPGAGRSAPLQVIAAVRGWPGVGKTTLATALAHEPDIAGLFPDGVLWTSLGQTPNVPMELAGWGRALGSETILRAATAKEVVAQLAGQLQNRRMLLIVDDVWEPEHAAPFLQACGKACAMLLTTREAGLAEDLATPEAVYYLPVLSEAASLELLGKLAPAVVKKFPAEAAELVRALECLPLALVVAGHLLHSEAKMPWGVADLLQALKEGAAVLEASAPADRIDLQAGTIPTVAVLLQKSTDRLDEQTRDCFAYLGAFAPKPATFDLAAMQAVWDIPDPKPVIRTLVSYGLLEPVGNRYQMHALLVAHAKALCEE